MRSQLGAALFLTLQLSLLIPGNLHLFRETKSKGRATKELFKPPCQVFHHFKCLVAEPPGNLQCMDCSKIFPAHPVLSFKVESKDPELLFVTPIIHGVKCNWSS